MKINPFKALRRIAALNAAAVLFIAGMIVNGAGAADAETIRFTGTSADSDSSAVSAEGATVTISAAGSYRLTGELADGRLVVDPEDGANVVLIFDGVSIHSSTGSPLAILNGKETEIVLADGSVNNLSNARATVSPDPETDEPNAALYSRADLTISGTGTLNLTGAYNDGINGKDTLTINGGSINVTAVDDGIRGKDALTVNGGKLTVTAGGDGLKSDNDSDAAKGTITISGGEIEIVAAGDGVSAYTGVIVSGGTATIQSGGGYQSSVSSDQSAKGVKAGSDIRIEAGTLTVSAAEDGIHSDGSIAIQGGEIVLSAGDDGIRAESALTIDGGAVTVRTAYEGLEAADITLNDGMVTVTSQDDSLNISDGSGGSQDGFGFGRGGFEVTDGKLTINGGTLLVTTVSGDSLDSNGGLEINGGLVLINGTTSNGNGSLDVNGSFTVNGGTLISVGSAGMAQVPDAASAQNLVMITVSGGTGGELVHIGDADGNGLMTFEPTTDWQALYFSSPGLEIGETYTLSVGGTVSGSEIFGYYPDGEYSGGTALETFTLTSNITTVGSGGFGGGPGGPGGGPGGPGEFDRPGGGRR